MATERHEGKLTRGPHNLATFWKSTCDIHWERLLTFTARRPGCWCIKLYEVWWELINETAEAWAKFVPLFQAPQQMSYSVFYRNMEKLSLKPVWKSNSVFCLEMKQLFKSFFLNAHFLYEGSGLLIIMKCGFDFNAHV